MDLEIGASLGTVVQSGTKPGYSCLYSRSFPALPLIPRSRLKVSPSIPSRLPRQLTPHRTRTDRSLTYLFLGLVALMAFYTWRFTVWADDAGGYWNLMTGKRQSAAEIQEAKMREQASSVSSAASSASSASDKKDRKVSTEPKR